MSPDLAVRPNNAMAITIDQVISPASADPRGTKRELRTQVQRARQSQPSSARRRADAARFDLLRELALSHSTVATYVACDDEPDTRRLLSWLVREGRRVLVPYLGPGPDLRVSWAWFPGWDEMRPGPRGIMQPTLDAGPEAIAEASLIICPALAASPTGDRLGTGGGWYDRALQWASPTARTVCLVDDVEVLASLPVDPWDRTMDWVATQTRLLTTGPSQVA